MEQGGPSSPTPKSCMQPLQASSSTFTPTSMHTHTNFAHLWVFRSSHIDQLHSLIYFNLHWKSAFFYIYTSPPFSRGLAAHISSSDLVMPSLPASSILTSSWPLYPCARTGWTGAGDEEGHVSWGRELTLKGAGKSWVGVLPSSDLGLVGQRKKGRCWGAWGENNWDGGWECWLQCHYCWKHHRSFPMNHLRSKASHVSTPPL